MTGKELLDKLSTLSEDDLELPVYIYADHGQTPENAYGVSIQSMLDGEFVHEDDIDEEFEYTEVIAIV